jgi:N-acetylmuramate 1-kinase
MGTLQLLLWVSGGDMEGVIDSLSASEKVSLRYQQMVAWLRSEISSEHTVEPLHNDASFRSYYRVHIEGDTRVVMDAPPEKESVDSFIAVGKELLACGICVPEIHAQNLTAGFLLLCDLGDDLYFKHLNSQNAGVLYARAFDCLLKIQDLQSVPNYHLPRFNPQRLYAELSWFDMWYVQQYRKVSLSSSDAQVLQVAFDRMVKDALSQPQVLVHKDFHSRNLFVLDSGDVGVIDFQDVLLGPVTYDLMSLLYDHYIAWPRERIKQWAHEFYVKSQDRGRCRSVSFEQFLRWHDSLMLQRVMKNLGNFVRLHVQRGKSGYLGDIPRIYGYLLEVTKEYEDYHSLYELLLRLKPEGVI